MTFKSTVLHCTLKSGRTNVIVAVFAMNQKNGDEVFLEMEAFKKVFVTA